MSLKPATSFPAVTPLYSSGWIRPNVLPVDWASRARSPAHSGATALVPEDAGAGRATAARGCGWSRAGGGWPEPSGTAGVGADRAAVAAGARAAAAAAAAATAGRSAPTAAITDGLGYLTQAFENQQPVADVARSALALFGRSAVAPLVDAGVDGAVKQIEAFDPNSVLGSPGGRRYLRELIGALREQLKS